MDHHERERERGRTSRASSTSSLGREVRCACQFFQSDSLLPERLAIMNATRPSSRNAAQPPIIRTKSDDAAEAQIHGEHEYEPIGTPLINVRTMTPVPAAPVVRIIDTDVVPVADSDESIDLRGRFTPGPVLEGNELILPLDGQIEDSAMETRELAGGGDTSEELESPQQLQDRLEERFLNTATPCTESRTDGEVNTSQVDSLAMEELPLRRGARGLPQRLRSQAGKLRTRIKSIQRPNFALPIDRLRGEKTKKSTEKSRGASEKSRSTTSDKRSSTSERARVSTLDNRVPRAKTEKRSRMERIRSSLPDRPRISLPDRPKFNFPDRSKFHLPERPKFNIKKPNIRFPKIGKSRRSPNVGDADRPQRSNTSSSGSKRNIFDFSTYPRFFDRKTKNNDDLADYATSSPKESRAQSLETSTLPRASKKSTPLGQRWSQKFTDIKFVDDEDEAEAKTLAERSRPWRRPSLEAPRLSLRPQDSVEEAEPLPWESSELNRHKVEDDRPYEDDENDDESEVPIRRPGGLKLLHRHASDDSYDDEPPRIDPRLYGDQNIRLDEIDIEAEEDLEKELTMKERETYQRTFMPVDPRYIKNHPGDDADELEAEDEEEPISSGLDEDISARSDREQQQSSASSCDRRRRGVIEEIDSDEFFLRAKGISQDDMNVGRYLTNEIRDALRTTENALAHEIILVTPKNPPQRPARTRSMRKRKETSVESYEIVAPTRPTREGQRRSMDDYDYDDEDDERIFPDNEESISSSRHRVVYHAESAPLDLGRIEPLDDIVVVKPIRRKSKASLRSQSLRRSESLATQPEEDIEMLPPSAPPRRKKRPRNEDPTGRKDTPRFNAPDACNGHHSPVTIVPENTKIIKAPAPKKPERASSRETLKGQVTRNGQDDMENVPPVPPKRSSRSRGTSLAPDDDRTSRGAESIPEIDYNDDDIPVYDVDNDSRLDYPGYAVIEKREKPPRPPPPRKRRDDKFATTPRIGKDAPKRPQRAYSTLRPARSRTPSEISVPVDIRRDSQDATAYEELDSENDEDRDIRSGIVVSKIQGRPLPAPPRPPRIRRDRTNDDSEDLPEVHEATPPGMSEAFASTQTDPLPDDMVIEEEITQAKLIVSPSRSGSQILVSTERIPSPTTHFIVDSVRSISPMEQIRDDDPGYGMSSEFTSEPPERTVSQIFDHRRRTPSPVRRSTVPSVPPLPMQKYRDDDDEDGSARHHDDRRSKSPALRRQIVRDDYELEAEARLQSSLMERLRLEDELERAKDLRSSLLSSETLKISSLEVGDLRVDRLNVTNLEAQKITASEIDALVVTATELSNTAEANEHNVDLHPTLLRELVAIRSQLELVNSSHEQTISRETAIMRPERRRDEVRPREITASTIQPSHLQLDAVSKQTETRALYSSVGSSRESSPQPTTPFPQITLDETSKKPDPSKDEVKGERRSTSRSRSSSPGRTGSPTGLRQIASPVKSLPPVISVTPDTPDVVDTRVESSVTTTPLRATISYVQQNDFSPESLRELAESQRPSGPTSSPTIANTRFIAFPTSQVPPEFFALSSPTTPTRIPDVEPAITDLGQQLFRALRLASKRAVRHFVGYIVNRIGHEDTDTKIREVEIALCALLLIIAGLLIVCFGGPRTVTHHHHWDYFNPPRL